MNKVMVHVRLDESTVAELKRHCENEGISVQTFIKDKIEDELMYSMEDPIKQSLLRRCKRIFREIATKEILLKEIEWMDNLDTSCAVSIRMSLDQIKKLEKIEKVDKKNMFDVIEKVIVDYIEKWESKQEEGEII